MQVGSGQEVSATVFDQGILGQEVCKDSKLACSKKGAGRKKDWVGMERKQKEGYT